MADFYYHYRVVSCREQHDTKAVGSKDRTVPFRGVYEYITTVSAASEAASHASFISEITSDIASAPQHINTIDMSSSLLTTALLACCGPSYDDSTDPAEGAWSYRVGKDVYRHEVGFSDTSAEDALANLTAKNLS
jgi:hypothetical protein